jgi:hypothetical protein
MLSRGRREVRQSYGVTDESSKGEIVTARSREKDL